HLANQPGRRASRHFRHQGPGQYTVAPPYFHADGGQYSWTRCIGEIVDAPLRLVCDPLEAPEAFEGELDEVDVPDWLRLNREPKDRSGYLYRTACDLGRYGYRDARGV